MTAPPVDVGKLRGTTSVVDSGWDVATHLMFYWGSVEVRLRTTPSSGIFFCTDASVRICVEHGDIARAPPAVSGKLNGYNYEA